MMWDWKFLPLPPQPTGVEAAAGETLMNRVSVFVGGNVREHLTPLSLFPLILIGHNQKMVVCKPGKGLCPDITSA